MAYKLTEKQRDNVLALDEESRFDYFLNKVLDWEQVWSLSSPQGWVQVSSEGEECLPIWPHPDFAAQWATGDWADCEPEAIALDIWLERWTPGMTEDGTLVAVFPVEDDAEGLVMAPNELLECLESYEASC